MLERTEETMYGSMSCFADATERIQQNAGCGDYFTAYGSGGGTVGRTFGCSI